MARAFWLKPLLNFSIITQFELASNFTAWLAQKCFIVGEEVSNFSNRSDSERLKHLITAETVTVNEKFKPTYTITNAANYIFLTNDFNLELPFNDRRYFIFQTPNKLLPRTFYYKFIKWRDKENGLNHLLYYLQNLDLKVFYKDAAPPVTDTKKNLITINRSDLDLWALNLFENPDSILANYPDKDIFTIQELSAVFNPEGNVLAMNSKNKLMGQALSRAGFGHGRIIRIRLADGSSRTVLLRVVRNISKWEPASNSDWQTHYERHYKRFSVNTFKT